MIRKLKSGEYRLYSKGLSNEGGGALSRTLFYIQGDSSPVQSSQYSHCAARAARIRRLMIAAMLASAAINVQAEALRDPQALGLAARSYAALAGGTAVNDVTLESKAASYAGAEIDTGPAQLTARGYTQSRVVLTFGDPRTEVRDGAAGVWDSGQREGSMAIHNCWIPASWFSPVLIVQALLKDPGFSLSYQQDEERQGISVHHLRAWQILPGQSESTVDLVQTLSRIDIYIDAATFLPAALEFNLHPDNDATLNIPTEVRFGDYRSVNSINTPFKIQKFMQNNLVLDVALTDAAYNSGLPESGFTLHGPAFH